MRLVTIPEAAERYGLSKDSIYAIACMSKKGKATPVKWYIQQGRITFIDLDELEKPTDIERKAWNLVTDSEYGIYWLISEHYGLTDLEQAEILADRSKHFNSVNSWRDFLRLNLFSLPVEVRLTYRYTMLIDYFRIMTRWIYEQIKEQKNEARI